MPDISVYDSSAVSDRVASAILAEFDISIVEWALPFELYWMPELTRTISKYESVSTVDAGLSIDGPGPEFGMEDRTSGYPRMPVWEISSGFAPAFNLRSDLLMPQRSGQGAFGGSLNGKLPAYSISASFVTPSIYISVAGRLPTFTLESTFGGILSGRIPTRSLTASFVEEGVFTLSRRRPVWELTAAFTAPSSFTLTADMPIWAVSAEMSIPWLSGSVSGNIPGAFVISASMYQEGNFTLDKDIPMWRLTSSMYSGSMSLDTNMPAWLIEEALDAVLQYSNRFSDYVLRYERP